VGLLVYSREEVIGLDFTV